MKKLMVLCLIVALTFCVTGATCMNNLQGQMCNPTPAVVTIVTAAVAIAETALTIFVKGSQQYIDAAGSLVSANGLLNSGCIATTDLNKLIAWLQSDPAKQAQATVAVRKMKAMGEVSSPLNVQPLIDWANKSRW